MWRAVGLQPSRQGEESRGDGSEQGGSCGYFPGRSSRLHAPKRASLHDARRHPESDARVRWVQQHRGACNECGYHAQVIRGGTVCVLGVGQTRGETPWTAVLTQQALAAGYPATLPPNLSMVLGWLPRAKASRSNSSSHALSRRSEPSRQCCPSPRSRYFFSSTKGTQATVAYLLGPGGRAAQGHLLPDRAQPRELSASEAHAGYVAEVRYWSGAPRRSCRARRADRAVRPDGCRGRHVLD